MTTFEIDKEIDIIVNKLAEDLKIKLKKAIIKSEKQVLKQYIISQKQTTSKINLGNKNKPNVNNKKEKEKENKYKESYKRKSPKREKDYNYASESDRSYYSSSDSDYSR
jgi:hypothetical protein